HDPILRDSEHDRGSVVAASPARLPAPTLMRHADDLIPRIDQLLGHDLPVVKRICELRDLSEHRLQAMQHAKQFRGVPLDLGIPDLLRNLVEFWAAEGVIESPQNVS